MIHSYKYKPGDRIVRASWPYGKSGTIVKAGRITGRVRFDGESGDETVTLAQLRPESAEDVAKRDRDRLMREWRDVRPETTIVTVDFNRQWGRGNEEIGASAYHAKTPSEMRTAARELEALADWFEKKPKE